MKKRLLGMFLAFTLVFTSAVPAFAGTKAEEYNKVDLKVISGGKTAVSLVADNNYKVTAKVENDVVDQKSVTMDLTMTNVGALDVDGTRHGSFTLDTGLAPQERALSEYMPALKEFKGARIDASVNGLEFGYDVEGKWNNFSSTGEWVGTPDSVDAVRAAWQELTGYVETTTYDKDDSKLVVANGSYMQIGNEMLHFEKDGDLVLNNLNDKDSLFQQIKDFVALDTEYVYEDQVVLYVAEGSVLRVGSSEATLTEGTAIRINGLDDSLMDVEPLAALREAANQEGATKELVVSALDIVDALLAGMNGEDVTVEIETDDYAKAKKAAEKLNLQIISNGYTALRVVADKDYVVAVDLLNDVVNQKSVTLDLTMNNVGGLDVNGTRHADFTFNTGLAPQERSLSTYMPAIKELKGANLEASVNGKAFDYALEGAFDAEDMTGAWVATPGDVEEVRAAWLELTKYVETKTYGEDNSYAVVDEASWIQVGNEKLTFEQDGDLVLDNLNDKDSIIDTIKKALKLETEVEAAQNGEIVVYVGAGTALRVGGSEAVLTEGTTIALDDTGYDFTKSPLADMREAAQGEGDMTMMINAALDIVNDVIAGANGKTIKMTIITDNYTKAAEDADKAIEDLGKVEELGKVEALDKIEIPEIKVEEDQPSVEIPEEDIQKVADAKEQINEVKEQVAAEREKVDAASEAYGKLSEEQKEELGYKVPEQIAAAEKAVAAAEKAVAEAEKKVAETEAKIEKAKADQAIKDAVEEADKKVETAEQEKQEALDAAAKAEEEKAAAEAEAKAKAEAEAAAKAAAEAAAAQAAADAKAKAEAEAAAAAAEAAAKKAAEEAAAKAAAAEAAQKEAEAKAAAAAQAAAEKAAAEKALNIIDKEVKSTKATTSTNKVSTSWKAVTGADGYKVQVVNSKGKVVKTYYTTKTSYSKSKLASGAVYTVKVTPYVKYDGKKVYGESVQKKAVTKPAKVVVKTKAYKNYIKVTAAKRSCTGYQVYVASNSKFSKNLKKYTVKSATLAKNIQKKTLKKGTNYIKVRAYTKSGSTTVYGAWSDVKKVTK